MPKFRYQADNHRFECTLACARCEAHTKAGPRCRRRTCAYLPYCSSHIVGELKVKIMPSNIQGAGKGLFAWNPREEGIIFRQGDVIAPYGGEILDPAQTYARYNGSHRPYGVQVSAVRTLDAACSRGTGAYANGSGLPGGNVVPNARLAVSNQGTANVKATKNIRHGQEIIIAYGPAFWRDHNQVQHSTR